MKALPPRSSLSSASSVGSTWKLTLPTLADDRKNHRRVIWSGQSEPDANILSEVLPIDISDVDLSDLVFQVIRHAPVKAIPKLFAVLTCQYDRVPVLRKRTSTGKIEEIQVIDVTKLTQAAANSGKSVCGQVFKRGDLVWTCRNCAKDATCVQCDPCFRKSNHQGHEVYFHRAGGDSGCCDCGDPEAWSKQGNCTDHSHEHGPDYDPSECLPVHLKRGFRAVVQGIISFLATYSVHSVRGFEPFENNQFLELMNTLLPTEQLVARVHNDDIHTYNDVTKAFQKCNKTKQESEMLTEKVDKEGSGIVGMDISSSAKLHNWYHEISSNAGLIFSIFPEALNNKEENLVMSLKWLLTVGNMTEGFRRIISEELLKEVASVPAHNIPLLEEDAYEGFQLSRVFLDENQFPHEVSQVAPIETLSLPLSCRISTFNGDEPTNEYEFKERVRFPFSYCHKNALSILCLSSPFVSSPIKKWLHDVIMRFQHDLMFKNGFAQIITTLYPTLAVLFCRHYGTAEESIFRTTVQIYTASSVADLMSSSGIGSRLLAEPVDRNILITNMLANTFYAILSDLKLKLHSTDKDEITFLEQHSIRKNRVSMICRDFEYLASDNVFSLNLLQ